MSRDRFHYLWLLPDQQSYRCFADIIRDLACRYGAPAFDPHVTLLGRVCGQTVTLVERVRHLAQAIGPFEVRISGVQQGDDYFRCVFLSATRDEVLANVRASAEQIFDPKERTEVYLPHLSLLYGNFPLAVRQQVAERLENIIPQAFTVDRLQLVAGAADVVGWRNVARFPLTHATA